MKAVTEDEIRESFANCTKGEAQRVPMPRDLDQSPWTDLDFLGWRDPGALDRGYLVTERAAGLVGIMLRAASSQRGFLHRSMCSLCWTTHPGSGVSLMTARLAGPAGRQGNSAGLYICSDLACSLYVRGKKQVASGIRVEETLTDEEQLQRLTAKLSDFLRKLGV